MSASRGLWEKPFSCPYGYLPGMEAAVVKWLGLPDWDWFHPNSAILHTTTYGVGQVMAQAMEGRHTPFHHRPGRQLDQ